MPSIYLSPSVQQYNFDVNGVTEETMMNYIADAMVPYLRLNGIDFTRNNPDMSVNQVVAESNRGDYDLHLSLHSNAAPESDYGGVRGSLAYYMLGSDLGRQYAQIFADNMKKIYPLPELVRIIPTTQLAELRDTTAPSVLYEIAFHDNYEDSAWITANVQAIAQNLSESVCQIFGKTLIPVCIAGTTPAAGYTGNDIVYGRVCTQSGPLNLRDRPDGNVILQLEDGEQMIVRGATRNGWTPVRYNAVNGYVSARFFCICNNPALPFSARLGEVSTDGGNLNIRQQPNPQANILAKAPNGSDIILIEDNDDYYRVNYQGVTGYAAREFIREI